MNASYLLSKGMIALTLSSTQVMASGDHQGGIQAEHNKARQIKPTFDIVHAKITTKNNVATFHMAMTGIAGVKKPSPTGQLAGSQVYSYVWPTTLNSSAVGFEANAGILTLAVTAHPDFDDTPLYDENGDDDTTNDGNVWHSHWVVLEPNEQCGDGALGVVDIPQGSFPMLPATWPGLPILLDSPGWDPVFAGRSVEVKVAFNKAVNLDHVNYDGVTAGLRVNQNVHAPLLCVVDVMDIASGDLSLPGIVNQ